MTLTLTRSMKALGLAIAASSVVAGTSVATSSTAEAKPRVSLSFHVGTPGYYAHGGHGYYGHWRPYRPCGWLRRKARRTGSPYWWRRYRRCMWRHF